MFRGRPEYLVGSNTGRVENKVTLKDEITKKDNFNHNGSQLSTNAVIVYVLTLRGALLWALKWSRG